MPVTLLDSFRLIQTIPAGDTQLVSMIYRSLKEFIPINLNPTAAGLYLECLGEIPLFGREGGRDSSKYNVTFTD